MLTRRDIARLAGATALVAQSQSAQAAATSRRAEAVALRRFAEQKHPRGLEAANDAGWRKSWSGLEAESDRLRDGAYIARLRRALAWFHDGHTTVLPFEFTGGVPAPLASGSFAKQMPVRMRVFHDAALIVQAKDEALPLLGAKIVKVQGIPIEKAIAVFVASWSGENPAWAHNWSWLLLASLGILEGLGIADATARTIAIEATGMAGDRIAVQLGPRPDAAQDLTPLPRTKMAVETFAAAAGRTNFVHPLPDRQALYVAIDEMADQEGYAFDQLTRDVLAAAASPEIRRIVIDLRRNGGGDNYKPEALRRELARSRFNAPGGL